MLKYISVLLLIVFLCTGCGLAPSESTRPGSSEIPSGPASSVSSEIPTEIRCPLLAEELRAAAPESVPRDTADALRNRLEAILAAKNYSEPAKTLVRQTLELLIQDYPYFQELFAFAAPYAVTDYVQMYMLTPLEHMVNNLYYCCEESPADLAWLKRNYDKVDFSGLADDVNKWIAIVPMCYHFGGGAEDDTGDASVLLHELFHAAVGQEHGLVSSRLYGTLNEGGATIA